MKKIHKYQLYANLEYFKNNTQVNNCSGEILSYLSIRTAT